MEAQTETLSAQKSFQIGRWNLIELLGSGATSEVFLGIDHRTYETVAIKLIFEDSVQKNALIKSEIAAHDSSKHANIIELKEIYEGINCVDEYGNTRVLTALVFEYAEGGDLFELIQVLGKFPEILARTYFNQLLDALEYIHSKGIVHRDLKIDNVLFDSSLSLKLTDFGYACKYSKGSKLFEKAGTSKYLAPEVHKGLAYDGVQAEIFSAGIILFSMVVGWLPFNEATENNELYKYIMAGDFNEFWKYHEQGKLSFSEDFKSLMNEIFVADPEKRVSIEEIRNTKWMSEQLIPAEDIRNTINRLLTNCQ